MHQLVDFDDRQHFFVPVILQWIRVESADVVARRNVNDDSLAAGDALKTDAATLSVANGHRAEVLVFDLPGR